MKTYSLYEMLRLGLLLKPNGEPYVHKGSARKRLKAFGHKPSAYNARGIKTYALTKSQINKINDATQNQTS